MRKIFLSLLFLLLPIAGLINTQQASAATSWTCSITEMNPKTVTTGDHVIHKMVIDTGGQASGDYAVKLTNTGAWDNQPVYVQAKAKANGSGQVVLDFGDGGFDREGNIISADNVEKASTWPENDYKVEVFDNSGSRCGNVPSFHVQNNGNAGGDLCTVSFTSDNQFKPGSNISMKVGFLAPYMRQSNDYSHSIYIANSLAGNATPLQTLSSTSAQLETGGPIGAFSGDTYYVGVETKAGCDFLGNCNARWICVNNFTVDAKGGFSGCRSDDDCKNDSTRPFCLPDANNRQQLTCTSSQIGRLAFNPCAQKGNIFSCDTAIGQIDTSAAGFARSVLQLFFAAAGLILLFTLILNGYKFMTSQGDEEKIKEAREGITSAIAGIIVVAFSLVILQFVTIDVLHLPGFGK